MKLQSPQEFKNSLNESTDANDPLLVKMRADAMKKEQAKKDALQKDKDKKNQLVNNKIDTLLKQKKAITTEMENDPDTELEGGKVADIYGKKLDDIDQKISKLRSTLNEGKFDKLFGVKPYDGNFTIGGETIVELEDVPVSINGNFICFDTKIVNLEGAPNTVTGDISLIRNKELISLDGSIEKVGDEIIISESPKLKREKMLDFLSKNQEIKISSDIYGPLYHGMKMEFIDTYDQLKQLPGYKRMLELGFEDDSSAIRRKRLVVNFINYNLRLNYTITQNGYIRRGYIGAKMNNLDNDGFRGSVESWNAGFDILVKNAEKFIKK